MPENHVTLDANTYEAIAQELAILRHQVTALAQAEAALRRQEQQFRSLVENIPGAVYRQECNADWTARFFSEAVEDVYGYPASDFINNQVRSVASVIHPDDREMVERLVHEAVAVRRPFVLEYRVNHGDGTLHWVYEKGQGVFSETGELLYLDGVVIDISDRVRGEIERKQAEQKLQDSENFLHAIINGVADPLFVKDEQHHYCFVSDSYCELIGSDRQALLGKTDYELFPSLEADEFIKADQLIFDTEIPQEHEEAITNHRGETRIFSTKKACFRDATGHKFMVATIRDITSRQETEQQLKNSENFLHAILNSIADPLFVKDQQHRYILANNAFREAFMGRSWSDMIGKTDHELFSTEEANALREADQRAFDTEIEQEDEELVTDVYGTTRTVSTKKSYFRNDMGHKLLVGTIRDITALKDAESALIQANEALENRVEERTAELRQTVVQLQQVIFDREQTLLELKQVETQLQEQAQFLQSIWDGVDYGIFVLNVLEDGTDFRYRSFNSAIVRHSPIPVKNLVGKTVRGSLSPDITHPLLKQFTDCVRVGQTLLFEERFVFEQDYLWWQFSVSPLRNRDGRIDQLIVTATDITDRKRIEEQRQQAEIALRQSEAQLRQRTQDLEGALQELQQTQLQLIQSEKMSSLGQLVAGVAHEINNPVNFIYGNLVYANDYTQDLLGLLKLYQQHYPYPEDSVRARAEAIDLDFLVQDMPRLLTSMKVGADRIQKIVASLRNFSRMDESEMKEVNIHDGIDSTLMILQNRLKAKPYFPEIKLIKEYGNLPLVECYAGQLNQVFMNILCNAIDALEENKMKFTCDLPSNRDDTVEIVPVEQDNPCPYSNQPWIRIGTAVLTNNRILISIADNGPGLSESARKRLFDPFFTTKPVGKGTGMGLSISYQIVTEKHGGLLQCNSSPGQGAEFLIEIPIRQRSPFPKSNPPQIES